MTTKEEVKALWKLCFKDSDEFVDLYFEQRYKDEINVAIRREGKVVSALQMIPYPMTFGGMTIETSYVSGACTHPDYRKQGLMHQLLNEAHRRMYEEGVWLSMLIPAEKGLFNYYARSGYAPSFGYARQTVGVGELRPSLLFSVVDETDNRAFLYEHYRYLSTCLQQCPCCVQHPREDFLIVMNDLRLSKGKLLVARRNGLIHGMAFCVEEPGKVVVKELLADNLAVRDSLLHKAAEVFQVEKVEYMIPSSMNSLYLGMARVINVEKMLAVVLRKYPEAQMYVHITGDEAIPENNGYFTITQGNCIREHLTDKVYQECSISDFTRLLLHIEHPYMSLMLN